jgi:2-oxoglutarate ferredoxin oxidoreductase subunit alpha
MIRKVMDNVKDFESYDEYMTEDADILIVTFGSTARAAMVAVSDARAAGIKAGLFRPITLWPFPEDRLKELSEHVKGIVVPEANLGQLIYEIQRVAHCKAPIVGVNKVGGVPIYPNEILLKIKELAK